MSGLKPGPTQRRLFPQPVYPEVCLISGHPSPRVCHGIRDAIQPPRVICVDKLVINQPSPVRISSHVCDLIRKSAASRMRCSWKPACHTSPANCSRTEKENPPLIHCTHRSTVCPFPGVSKTCKCSGITAKACNKNRPWSLYLNIVFTRSSAFAVRRKSALL
jgi:hypothetical protein